MLMVWYDEMEVFAYFIYFRLCLTFSVASVIAVHFYSFLCICFK